MAAISRQRDYIWPRVRIQSSIQSTICQHGNWAPALLRYGTESRVCAIASALSRISPHLLGKNIGEGGEGRVVYDAREVVDLGIVVEMGGLDGQHRKQQSRAGGPLKADGGAS